MSQKNRSYSLLLWSYVIGVNGILLIPVLIFGIYCSVRFIGLWNNRYEFTKAKVFDRIIKEDEEREQKTLQSEEAEADSDKEYQSVDFQVPAELMEKVKKEFYAKRAGKNKEKQNEKEME